jgi:hypothetical protein
MWPSAVTWPARHRASAKQRLGEIIATLGLVVFGTVRSGRSGRAAYAVGAYILAATWVHQLD